MNELLLCGDILDDPTLSHTNHGREFMTFPLSVCRLSGTADRLTVIAPDNLCHELRKGMTVTVAGELRSYNDREAAHNRLKINAWAKNIAVTDDEHSNRVVLDGRLCKPAVYRRTPFGREIADMMLCVAREYQPGGPRRFDYIPCIAWGSVARMCAAIEEHCSLHVEGRLQSRIYMKQIDGMMCERTAYEVSLSSAEVIEEQNACPEADGVV